MITTVKIANFKSIGEPGVELELKPLTLLVGPNGGGKSSILEAIAVAAQGGSSGRLVQFPDPGHLWHKRSPESQPSIVLGVPPEDDSLPGAFLLEFRLTDDPYRPRVAFSKRLLAEIVRENDATNAVNRARTRTFLISALRGSVPFTGSTHVSGVEVGPRGANLIPYLALLFSKREHREVADTIARWADRFGVSDLKAGFWGDNVTGADYEDKALGATLDLALASAGARQVLVLITQLFAAGPGSLVMVEEPEISLHPEHQLQLLEMFGEAIKGGRQVLATTHSIFLVSGLGYAVAKGWLKAEDVAVFHVEKTEGEGTQVTPLPVNEQGRITRWVPSFAKVEAKLLRQVVESVPEA